MVGSDALTVLPYSVVFLSRRTVPLAALPLKIDHPDRQLGLLSVTDHAGPPAVGHFVASIGAEMKRLQARMDQDQKASRRGG